MDYAILRVGKLKTWSAVTAAQGHNLRTRPTPNADPTAPPPRLLHGSNSLIDAVKERFKSVGLTKWRKDAVLCSEMVLTGSPDVMAAKRPEELEAWVAENVAWLRERYGQNFVHAVLHLDESTPHIHACVVPLTPDNKLSAKRFWGEAAGLSALQTEYAARMAPHGLQRGIKGSKATHKALKSFYAALTAMEPIPSMPKMPPRPRPEDRKLLGFVKAEEVMSDLRAWRNAVAEWSRQLRETLSNALKALTASQTENERLRAERVRLCKDAERGKAARAALRLLKEHPEGLPGLLVRAESAREARRASLEEKRGETPRAPPGGGEKREEQSKSKTRRDVRLRPPTALPPQKLRPPQW